MKFNCIKTNECPFSNNHCYKRDSQLSVECGHAKMVETGIVYTCPFFNVIDDDSEHFIGECKINSLLEKLLN